MNELTIVHRDNLPAGFTLSGREYGVTCERNGILQGWHREHGWVTNGVITGFASVANARGVVNKHGTLETVCPRSR